jgi:pilus assembly protein Flp/PilA
VSKFWTRIDLRSAPGRRLREDGASAVEYGLLVAGIAGLIVAIVFLFGDAVSGLFDDTCGAISAGGTGHISANC